MMQITCLFQLSLKISIEWIHKLASESLIFFLQESPCSANQTCSLISGFLKTAKLLLPLEYSETYSRSSVRWLKSLWIAIYIYSWLIHTLPVLPARVFFSILGSYSPLYWKKPKTNPKTPNYLILICSMRSDNIGTVSLIKSGSMNLSKGKLQGHDSSKLKHTVSQCQT